MEWIKCSERMPPNSLDVTLFSPTLGVFNGYFWPSKIGSESVGFYSNSGEHDDGLKADVTHWMPLPPPPAE